MNTVIFCRLRYQLVAHIACDGRSRTPDAGVDPTLLCGAAYYDQQGNGGVSAENCSAHLCNQCAVFIVYIENVGGT